jgi:hypothetical protein
VLQQPAPHEQSFGTLSAFENRHHSKTANKVIANRSRVPNILKELAMKRIALCLAIVAVLAACPKPSEASDLTEILRIAFGTNHHAYRHAAQRAHVGHHVDLEARAIEREVVSRVAHQQPLTQHQDARLHRELDRARAYDALEHDEAHATGAYARTAYSPRIHSPRAYPPQYTRSYRGNPNGYGVQYRSSQYRPSPYGNPVGCSPYGRY